MTTRNIKRRNYLDPNLDYEFHKSKAKRNERFYRKYDLDNSTFNEWAIVTLFYSAVHYVDAVLSKDNSLSGDFRQPVNHFMRRDAILKCIALLPIGAKYLQLESRSRQARYDQTCFPDKALSDIKANLFIPIQNHVRKYLGIKLETES